MVTMQWQVAELQRTKSMVQVTLQFETFDI